MERRKRFRLLLLVFVIVELQLCAADVGIDCEPCAPGYVTEGANCTGCPMGQCPKGLCVACQPGQYANVEGTQCLGCPPGFFSNVTAAVECIGCREGHYNPYWNATTCVLCSEGMFVEKDNATHCVECWPGSRSTWERKNCEWCKPGYESTPGRDSCQMCRRGTFSQVHFPNCFDCDSGYYQDEEGQSVCKECSSGSYTNSPGGTSCSSCPALYRSSDDHTSCEVTGSLIMVCIVSSLVGTLLFGFVGYRLYQKYRRDPQFQLVEDLSQNAEVAKLFDGPETASKTPTVYYGL